MTVNVDTPKIELILERLKNSTGNVSGEELAEDAGVSRVAVWKMVNKLKNDGYDIQSGRNGYRLTGLTESPLPRELGRPNDNISYFRELDSTMKKADLLVHNGCSDGTTIIAGRQTSGVNSKGGSWESPDGGLYFTRIRTAPLPIYYGGIYGTAITAAAADLLRKLFDISAELRWPNEIICGGKKLGGVLTRFGGELNIISSICTGIGINANINPADLPDNAASISQLTGETVSIKMLLSKLLEVLEGTDHLFPGTGECRTEVILDNCKENMETIGRLVKIRQSGSVITGTAVDIKSTGELIIKSNGGDLISVHSGEDYNYV